jgi:4'-phosphopantetheinyl transferase
MMMIIDVDNMSLAMANACPKIKRGMIHVWTVHLDNPDETQLMLANTLSAEELLRAGRFHFERDCQRFIACRLALRKILAGYLRIEPAQVRFSYGKHGKPTLGPTFLNSGLQFNISHSHGIALVACSYQREIGVDIERIRPLPGIEQIVERYFAHAERIALQLLPTRKRTTTFFDWWTCKEAYLKALGKGLAYPLDRIDVSMVTEQPTTLVSADSPGQAGSWTVRLLSTVPGYAAALVVGDEGHCHPTGRPVPRSDLV